MPAPIVYDGVGGDGGTLFQGTKFWVAQRVPIRQTLLQHIESNGGLVVPLEKQADILIADHIRKDAPAGSYSWKYIEKSVKNGALENKEDHLAGRQITTSRHVGSSEPGKRTRAKFTPQDDEILKAWILECKAAGERLLGNKIYQELETIHPQHTWQSWRSRSATKLAALHETDQVDDQPSPTAPAPVRRSPRQVQPNVQPTQQQHIPFTEGDDQLLLEYVEKCKKLGHAVKGFEIYQKFALMHPHRTYQSWHGRYVKTLIHRGVKSPSQNRSHNTEGSPAQPKPQGQREGRPSPRRSTPASTINMRHINERSRQRDEEARREAAVRLIQRTWRGYSVRRRETARINHQANDDTPHDMDGDDQVVLTDDVQSSEISASPGSLEQQFYYDLEALLKDAGAKSRPILSIGKRAIDLWQLWNAVESQNSDPESRDWEQVAEQLGFDWVQEPHVVHRLRAVYEETLLDLEYARRDFDGASDNNEDSDTEEVMAEGVLEEDVEDADGSQIPLPSTEDEPTTSPSLFAGVKRTLQSMFQSSDDAPPSNPRKRVRLDRNREIPSTPDAKPTQLGSGPFSSDSGGKAHHTHISPILDSMREEPHRAPLHLENTRGRAFEPETQDFAYDPETQAPRIPSLTREETTEITPSQQLHIEFEDQAIPFSLSKGDKTITPKLISSRDLALSQKARGKLPEPSSSPQTNGGSSPGQQPKRRVLPPSFGRSTPMRGVSAPTPPSNPKVETASRRQSANQISGRSKSNPEKAKASAKAYTSTHAGNTASRGGSGHNRPHGEESNTVANPLDEAVSALDAAIERWVSMGYSETIVIKAIKATTGDPGLTGVVMESLKTGEGIPTHHEGIWTKRDDELLHLVASVDFEQKPKTTSERQMFTRAVNARKKLEHKHGSRRMMAREEFLEPYA